MHGRLSFLAFLLYLTLDLSSPFVAGAFNFDPDDCVDAAHRQQRANVAVDAVVHVAHQARESLNARPQMSRRMPVPAPRPDWRLSAPVAHAAAPPPPSPTEDH